MKTTVNSARRGFLWKAGAALAAPLAVGAESATAHAAVERDTSQARLAELEDVNAIRELTRRYVRHVNAGAHDEAAALFAEPARADTRAASKLAADPLGGEDAIEIAASGTTATARLPCAAESETPIEPVTPLVAMARAQGGGVVRRSERGVLEGAYVRRDGGWKIERLTFRAG
jgi:SnoaL-like protein